MTENNPLPTHFLYPSALFVRRNPHIVTTVLGSCVAVCLFDRVRKIGGINHYMLPLWNGRGLASPKYGNIAIEKLVQSMLEVGCSRSNLDAKIFGGGEVLDLKNTSFDIGNRNIKIAFDTMAEYNIPIVAKSVGGNLGRKLLYNTGTGGVKQKYVQKSCKI